MNAIRALFACIRQFPAALKQQRLEAHSKWKRKQKVLMPKLPPDQRMFSNQFYRQPQR